VVEVDRERGRIGLRLADDPEVAGKTVEELASVGSGDGGPRRERSDRGPRDRDRDRGPRDRDRDRGPRDRDRDRGPRDRDRDSGGGRVRDRDPDRA
jgi:polyribonucleotide nucleotidyltransferase